jgi:hypothetical protein
MTVSILSQVLSACEPLKLTAIAVRAKIIGPQ